MGVEFHGRGPQTAELISQAEIACKTSQGYLALMGIEPTALAHYLRNNGLCLVGGKCCDL